MEFQERMRSAASRTLVSSFVFLAMAIAKILVGYLTNLTILVADGIHNVADFLMFLTAYAGLRLSQIGPTRTFRYGLYKAENLSSFLMGLFIIYAVYEVVKEGLVFFHPYYPALGIIVQAASIAVDLLLALWLARLGLRQVGLVSAETLHNYIDSLMSFIVLVGIVAAAMGQRSLYYALLIVTALMIAYQDIYILRDSTYALLDATDRRIERIVDEVIRSMNEVVGYHDLRVRKAGPYYFVEMHLELPPGVSVKRADRITDVVEQRIKEREPLILMVNPHVEPSFAAGQSRMALFVGDDGRISNFAEAQLIIVVNPSTGEEIRMNNPIRLMERRRLKGVIDLVREQGITSVVVNRIEEPTLYALAGAGVDVYLAEGEDYSKALRRIKSGELKPLEVS
ncbi:MAG: cation diffusion facilitator family transporter [Nitrososphaeria archaeon]